jgi:hypothetical protein
MGVRAARPAILLLVSSVSIVAVGWKGKKRAGFCGAVGTIGNLVAS